VELSDGKCTLRWDGNPEDEGIQTMLFLTVLQTLLCHKELAMGTAVEDRQWHMEWPAALMLCATSMLKLSGR
jgi:hypothetical protein